MSRQKALIVDDEPDIRELLEITLGRMKLDTRSARNVKEARELLAREPFDLCLTDMRRRTVAASTWCSTSSSVTRRPRSP